MNARISMFLVIALGLVVVQSGMTSAATCSILGANLKIIGVTWGNSSHQISAGPGDSDVPLAVSLENYGSSCNIQDIEGSLQLSGGLTALNGSLYPATYVPSAVSPSIFSLIFYLNIAKNTSSGPNDFFSYPLTLAWNYTNSSNRYSQSYNIEVPMKGDPSLSFAPEKPSLNIGQLNNVAITLRNRGTGIATGIVTAVSSSSGLSIVDQPNTVNSLGPGESENVSVLFYVPPGDAGQSVVLDLASHYISPYGYNTSISSQLGFYALPSPQTPVTVYPSTQTLYAGRIQSVNVTVSNGGSSAIDNVSVVLTPQSPLNVIGRDNYVVIPEVLPGSNFSFPVSLYSESSSGTVSTLDVGLTYTLNNQVITSSRFISFLTPGYINITKVSTVVTPQSPIPGQIFSIISTLDNLGSQAAVAATVTPYPPSGIAILGQNTTFIGDISVDTPTAFTISFTAKSSAKAGTYYIPVRLSYLNNLDQQLNTSFVFAVNVSSSLLGGIAPGNPGGAVRIGNGSFNSTGGTYYRRSGVPLILIAIAVIIAAAVAYLLYRRRKRKLKSVTEQHTMREQEPQHSAEHGPRRKGRKGE